MNGKRLTALTALTALLVTLCCLLPVSAGADDVVVLRICNWEEYIDEGKGWEEENEETKQEEPVIIDLESGDICGHGHALIEDFEQWYFETYGIRVRVEYSTFGTNEDLYNMLTIGDVYDLVCPSDYMIMKLMAEDQLVPLSAEFRDPENENNHYVRGLSPYIRDIFDSHEINGDSWSEYAAGYMWGITGFVYNPDVVTEEEASTWKLLENRKFFRQITIKDNVRDSYFAAVGAMKSELLTSEEFCSRDDYAMALQDEMNDVSQNTIDQAQHYLQQIKDNLYSFETDSGKADMITGKVVANYQWSGDAVFTMDEAEKDGYYLNFAVPRESTNIYFDGWVMLKCGIGQDKAKQHAAEAFINFVSRPDNAIRNMYIIGYTSVISASDDGRIFEYLEWNYAEEEEGDGDDSDENADDTGEDAETAGNEEEADSPEETEATGETAAVTDEETADTETETTGEAEAEEPGEPETDENGEDAEEIVEYDLSYFFGGEDCEGEYVLPVPAEQLKRQLSAQYPSREVIRRASIMVYFDEGQNEAINRMWIRVRCFNIYSVPVWVWIVLAIVIAGGIAFWINRKRIRNRQYE